MQVKLGEITDILRRHLEGVATSVEMAEVGTVVSVGDGIARVFGLDRVMAGEMVQFPHGVYGLALNLEEDSVGCVLLGESSAIKEGDEVRRTGKILSVPVGPGLVGRVVNPLGERWTAKDPSPPPSTTPWSALPLVWCAGSP